MSREALCEVGHFFISLFDTLNDVYYVYILQLMDNSYYIGYSTDLKKRIKNHSQGLVESTKNLRPIKLVYYSAFSSNKKAIDFEKYLKSSSGFAFRNKRLIDNPIKLK